MLCVASPLPQKYEENMSICLGNGQQCSAEHNYSLLYWRKWCDLGQMELLSESDHLFPALPQGRRHVRKGTERPVI